MEIVLLNSRVTFQKSVLTVDEIGNHKNEWVDAYSCYATISNSSGKSSDETEVAGTIADTSDMSFTVRYCKKASEITTTTYRLVYNDECYDIVKIDLLNLKKKALKFKCQKVRR